MSTVKTLKPSRLTTLSVDFLPMILGNRRSLSTYPFLAFLLKHCQDTLTSFDWSNGFDTDRQESDELRSAFQSLIDLRKLRLHGGTVFPSELDVLIRRDPESKLVHLNFDYPRESDADFLNTCRQLGLLKTFIWYGRPKKRFPVDFLEANPQLETLYCGSLDSDTMAETVLPLLVHRFSHLRSLALQFAEEVRDIPAAALSAIARLKTLQQLLIKAGHEFGWRRTWVADHAALRACIRRLPLLKRLALSRDTYYAKQDRQDDPERYYSAGVIDNLNDDSFRLWGWVHRAPERNDDDAEDIDEDEIFLKRRDWAWEMQHRRRMLIEGRRYVDLRYEEDGPKLEFLYIGMLPMNVKLGWYGYRAVAATERRDDCWNLLRRIFHGEEDLFTQK
jgi:hypothetical protein